MGRNGVWHSLHKRHVGTYGGARVYSVNAFAVRNSGNGNEEFGCFATHNEFARLIPKGEIWIADKVLDKEGVFFMANALAQLKERERGASEDRAYDEAEEVERSLREKILGVEFRDGKPHKHVPEKIYGELYTTIPDPEAPVRVWLVDGALVRGYYKTDYTEGGHDYVYRWVPRNEIWIEEALHPRERPFIVCHEYLERRLMRDEGIDYDRAHSICSKVEYEVRKGEPIASFLTTGRKPLSKPDLVHLPSPEFFAHVVRYFVRH